MTRASTETAPALPLPATPADPARAAWPYLLPLAVYLGFTALEGWLPRGAGDAPAPPWYAAAYAFKVVAVGAVAWACRSTWRDLRPRPSWGSIALAVAAGLAVAAAWVGLDGWYPEVPMLGRRVGFDPNTLSPEARPFFLAVRLAGLVLVVPLIEELFYRSFLMRWIVDPDFQMVPLGRVTPAGLGVTTVVFASSHPEWLPALLTGLAWGALLAKTRSVSACVLSHAVANLTLGLYVLKTAAWQFW